MRQLSRYEILGELKRRGFRSSDATPIRYAEQWSQVELGELVNIKKDTEHCPLVIHSRHQAIQEGLEAIPGVVVGTRPFRKSSQFKGFVREENDKVTPSYLGIDYGFSSYLALTKFLDVLLGQGASLEEDLGEIRKFVPDKTTAERLVQARLGQGKYRADLIAIWEKCSVTECANGNLLRASHIKPWKDSTNEERLDPHNGLLLAAGLDAAFDKGLISFNDEGELLVGAALSGVDAEAVGIQGHMRLRKDLSEQTKSYLAEHRQIHGFTRARVA